MPDWLKEDYCLAIKKLAEHGAQHFHQNWPAELTQSFLAVAAFAKDASCTGRVLSSFSEAEMKDVFEKFFE